MRAQVRMLPDGRRLHPQDGPIDLVVEAFGPDADRLVAHRAAAGRFATVLDELCAELHLLRAEARPGRRRTRGTIAGRMEAAVAPFAGALFVTSMAAVAGSVAEEVLTAMTDAAPLSRAYVNNGGDIALHLAPGESFRVGLIDRPDATGLLGSAIIRGEDGVRGIATSGWHGRSFSLGIADAVTVLAATAAQADAAATVIANAVDLPGHPGVRRAPARDVQCDSDLGARLVTRDVPRLARSEIEEALGRGRACAEALWKKGLIRAAALHLQGVTAFMDLPSHPASWPDLARPSTKAGSAPRLAEPAWCDGQAWMAGPSPAMTTVGGLL